VTPTPRGQRTRQLIIERASGVFAENGFAAASLSRLVAATGLTRGAFYFHFDSKDALAQAIVQEQAERLPLLLARVQEGEPDPLRRLLRLAFGAAVAVQTDFVMAAAGRLTLEHALIHRPLPELQVWWVGAIKECLAGAAEQGELPDLSRLLRDGPRPEAGPEVTEEALEALAGQVWAGWIGLRQAAMAVDRKDVPDRIYTSWVVLMPWLSSRPERRDELLALVAEFTDQLRNQAAPDEPS
jgi:AcrR family transcriptional regulator